MMYYVYILKSQKDDKFYIGITKDVDLRLKQHNSGKVRSTKSRRPFKIIKTESYSFKRQALKREKYLKSYRGFKERSNWGL